MPKSLQLFRVVVVSLLIILAYVTLTRISLSVTEERYFTIEERQTFGRELREALVNYGPGIDPIQRRGNAEGVIFWRATTDTPRPDLLDLTENRINQLKSSHAGFRHHAEHTKLLYRSHTSGIVSSATGKYLPVFIISLRMIRRSGCNLPVELIVDTVEEIESQLCTSVLPELNARCLRLEDVLGSWTTRLAGYQIKTFAILASSFENVLFLDADVFLAKDVTHVFQQKPFSSSGIVTWPDFWASSASTHLFEIIGQPVPALNTLASTESGQVLISKSSHGLALLLAAYYNYWGPDHYYPLMSQGGPGEGDKESFITAARAANAPFYQVKKCVDTIGYYEDGRYYGGAMLQYDPTQDTNKPVVNVAIMEPMPDAFSVHHNIPKYDPVELFALNIAVDATTGLPHRIMTTDNLQGARFSRDVERELWEEIEYVACELGDQGLVPGWRTVPSTAEQKGTCDTVQWYRSIVFLR